MRCTEFSVDLQAVCFCFGSVAGGVGAGGGGGVEAIVVVVGAGGFVAGGRGVVVVVVALLCCWQDYVARLCKMCGHRV